jgi:mannose/fructose/N-acetylgalactosamine-specific phosphotransferase system component IID
MAWIDTAMSARLVARSLAIQGSWNYRTMQGAGLCFALLPFLARLHRGEPRRLAEAVARHSSFYNGHPYLSTVAIAALARMESEGASSQEMERFKQAVVSPLGSLGDQLVWARIRPLCSMMAVLIFVAGGPWWLAVALFLLMYNFGNLGLRIWGLRVGFREGRRVARALIASPLRRLPDRLTIPLVVVVGAVLPPLALSVSGTSGAGPLVLTGIALALALAFAGAWRPLAAARVAVLGLVAGSLTLLALGSMVW